MKEEIYTNLLKIARRILDIINIHDFTKQGLILSLSGSVFTFKLLNVANIYAELYDVKNTVVVTVLSCEQSVSS